jgi:hypothetical protein
MLYETDLYFSTYCDREFPKYLRHLFFLNIAPCYGLLLTEVSGQRDGPVFEK